jgi:hypothetical protein
MATSFCLISFSRTMMTCLLSRNALGRYNGLEERATTEFSAKMKASSKRGG